VRSPLHLGLLFSLSVFAPACGSEPPRARAAIDAAAASDALAVSAALEALIAKGKDTRADREYAYQKVCEREENTAAYAFARAAVTGRLVQMGGLSAVGLVGEVERWARRSRELDPEFRSGAATRLLGTLYVLAPGALLEHGDSEEGLSLLEGLVQKHPDVLENHLRLAEAYIALGDPGPARPHLCQCLAQRAALRPDDQDLLLRLVRDAQNPDCPTDPAGAVRAPQPSP